MNKIRVMVVDDAVVVRRVLAMVLSADQSIEVVATAANGKIALSKLPLVKPDLIVLDVEMPEMDGLETLTQLRRTHAKLPVIMFSASTQAGAAISLEALHRGASDVVAKPSSATSMDNAFATIGQELISRIKAFCIKPSERHTPSSPVPPVKAPPRARPPGAGVRRVDLVVIGVSTGGPNALAEVLPRLPRDLPVPVLVVQHMPPVFTHMLAERLATKSAIGVEEARPCAELTPGRAWIAPGDYHLLVERDGTTLRLRTNQQPQENSCRPSVDVLFRSVAELCGENALAVVMTGMGHDGLGGCERIRAAGGQVIIQDEASSVVWGMPGAVAKAGLADQVVPLDQLAGEIMRRLREGRFAYSSQLLPKPT